MTGLSSAQLHEVADRLRQRYTPPSPMMSPADYVSHEAMHALARALDDVADG